MDTFVVFYVVCQTYIYYTTEVFYRTQFIAACVHTFTSADCKGAGAALSGRGGTAVDDKRDETFLRAGSYY